jgi:ribose transport system permease protein
VIRTRLFLANNRPIVLAYAVAAALLGIIFLLRPGFASPTSLTALFQESALLGLICMGQTLVVLSGGLDLSVPSVLAASGIVLTGLTLGQDSSLVWAVPLVLLGSAVIGAINGLGVAYFEIQPLVMTLAMNTILFGAIAGIVAGGLRISGQGHYSPPLMQFMIRGTPGGVPMSFLLLLGAAILLTLFLSFSGLGRRIYLVGTNRTVSRYSGINVRFVLLAVYTLAGALNGIAGMLLVGKTGFAFVGIGEGYLFPSVVAVLLGGAAIGGGVGHYIGTIPGAIILTLLTYTLPVFNIPRGAQFILYALVVLIAVRLGKAERAVE